MDLCVNFFAAFRFLTTIWWLINTSWVTLLKVYDVERPETPNNLGKSITDDEGVFLEISNLIKE